MSGWKKLASAAAATGGGLNVEDVFSTYLYTGQSGTTTQQTITNGIDLSTEGGLVWVKKRDGTTGHYLVDTERGADYFLATNLNDGETYNPYTISGFTSSGFTLGQSSSPYFSGGVWAANDYTSFSFRKAPKFFDVVTYTGDGANSRTISHNLGSDVGMVIIKRTDSTSTWAVWHRGLTQSGGTGGGAYNISLESTGAQYSTSYINSTTSSDFTVGGGVGFFNWSGATFVAYLFAHNNNDANFGPTGDQDIIKCGSYTGDGQDQGPDVTLGFEPQWIMIKRTDSAGNWIIVDSMRGIVTNGSDNSLYAENSIYEISNPWAALTPTGFKVEGAGSAVNANGGTYIYIAIRRGPMAVPTSATDVFAIDQMNATSSPLFKANFPVDFGFYRVVNTDQDFYSYARLMQGKGLWFNTQSEFTDTSGSFDYMDGWYDGYGSNSGYYSWMWRRAPNFFDVVAYTGNGTAGLTVDHNLGVEPEMIWVKARSSGSSEGWNCYFKTLGNTYVLFLNNTFQALANSNYWDSTTPTATQFTLGDYWGTNKSSIDYIAYLFASLDGVSKVGSYTGNGSTQTINCGFSSGARFVLIKRTDSTGDWYVWDTERGIVAGNDPHLALNRNDQAEVTTDDSIDPVSSGFAVNQVAATNINVSSASYIYYAIA